MHDNKHNSCISLRKEKASSVKAGFLAYTRIADTYCTSILGRRRAFCSLETRTGSCQVCAKKTRGHRGYVLLFFQVFNDCQEKVRLVEVRQKPLLEKNTINQCCFSYVCCERTWLSNLTHRKRLRIGI